MRVFLLAFFLLAFAGIALYGAAADKLRLIQTGHPRAGGHITLTAPEIRQWIQGEGPFWASFGATNLRLTLGNGRATGYADVDFLKARKAATGEDPGWLLRNLVSGKKPIAVTARFTSANGKARVDVERVEVNGIGVEGTALDYLIQDYVKPNFPYATVSEWFPMAYRIDRFTVAPSGITVVIGK